MGGGQAGVAGREHAAGEDRACDAAGGGSCVRGADGHCAGAGEAGGRERGVRAGGAAGAGAGAAVDDVEPGLRRAKSVPGLSAGGAAAAGVVLSAGDRESATAVAGVCESAGEREAGAWSG